MGTYLSTPVLDKHTEKGSDMSDTSTPVSWAVVDMQGWRKSMEDAHVARTDVPMPGCGKGYGIGGENGSAPPPPSSGGGEGGNNDSEHAKVFAVFDGHGGAEVARFCQIHLVPVLIAQGHWSDALAAGGEGDDGGRSEEVASRVGRALVDSFHALDRLIDDPNSKPEIEKWRSERPPPYEPGQDEHLSSLLRSEQEHDPEDLEVEDEDMDVDEMQSRRHTIMDASEMAQGSNLHLLDDGDDDSSDEEDDDGNAPAASAAAAGAAQGTMEEGEEEKKGDEGGDDAMDEGDQKETLNMASMLDAEEDDDEDEVFEDSLSEPTDDDDLLENRGAEGTVRDDSDDEAVKSEKASEADDDDGEVVKKDAPSGTMVLSANDAVALFQKLLHMNGSGSADDDDEDDDGAVVVNGEKMNGDAGGGGGTTAEVVVPTKEQLLNPPTGIVAPSVSVPTRILNGRKICNLPDHPVHAGCTSVVAVIVGRTLVVANAGDSRAVICRAGGLTEPLSFDHKPLQNREMNRITNAGGFVNQFGRVNGNLNLSRSIGDLKYKQVPGIPPAEQMITAEPDILSTSLRPGDEFLILGCDGIWDCLSNEECVKYVRDRIDEKRPHEIGAEMLDEIVSADPRASQGIGGDNMTIMIVDLLPHSRSYNKDC